LTLLKRKKLSAHFRPNKNFLLLFRFSAKKISKKADQGPEKSLKNFRPEPRALPRANFFRFFDLQI